MAEYKETYTKDREALEDFASKLSGGIISLQNYIASKFAEEQSKKFNFNLWDV